jgi:hypothetical protein
MDVTLPDEESGLESVLQDTDASSSLMMLVGGTAETVADDRSMMELGERWV